MSTPRTTRRRGRFILILGIVAAVMLGIAGASRAYVQYVNITSPTNGSPVTLTSLPGTVSVTFSYRTGSYGTTTAWAWLTTGSSCSTHPAVAGTTIPTTNNTSQSTSLDVPVPAGTANGSYRVCVDVYNPGSSYPIEQNDGESGAVVVDVPVSCSDPGSGSATGLPFTSSFGCSNTNSVTMDGWVDSDGSGTLATVDNGSPRSGSPTAQHARLADGGTITRTLDTSGYQDIHLSYYWRGDSSAEPSDYLRVYWKLNSSGSYTELASYALNTTSWSSQVDLTLPASAADTTIQIRFVGDSNQSNEQARVDDVSVTGTAIVTKTDVTAAITASDKTYDGTTDADYTCAVVGATAGDDVSCDGTHPGTFSQAGVGTDLEVTATGLALSGSDAGKYNLTNTTDTDTADITPAGLTVVPDDKTMTYGGTVPAFTFNLDSTSFFGSDTWVTAPTCGTAALTAFTSAPVRSLFSVAEYTVTGSPYAISCTGGDAGSNYTVNENATGDLTVDPVTLTVTPDPQSITYGDPLPDFTFSLTGSFVGSDDWSTEPTCSAGAGPFTVAGSPYTISCSGGDAGDNYTVVQTATAELTIGAATLTVTADDKSAQYSDASPTLTFAYSGFVGTDDASVIETQPTCNTTRTVGDPAGTYPITCSGGVDTEGDYTFSYVNGTFTVLKENAAVLFDGDNPVAYQVSTAGGDYTGTLTLKVDVREKQPDLPLSLAAAGDIGNSGLSNVTLAPLAGGSSITLTCGPAVSNGATGYAKVLTYTCQFTGSIPVGTYDVTATVTGNYYTGEGLDGFTVYDPSLGFATGGGTFLLAGDKVNFGFVMKYTKKGNNVKGSFLAVRHYADGTIARIKSNALDGLALQESNGCGIATFSGKSTYMWWDPTANEGEGGYLNVGGQDFAVYAKDCNQPGTGEDFIWIRGTGELTMPAPATSNAAVLTGGNIAVPHT